MLLMEIDSTYIPPLAEEPTTRGIVVITHEELVARYRPLYQIPTSDGVLNIPPGLFIRDDGDIWDSHHRRMIPQFIDGAGYRAVKLNGYRCRVYRLVAFVYIPLPAKFKGNYLHAKVNHIVTNDNAHYSNLKWVTRRENAGLRIPNAEVVQMDMTGKTIRVWRTQKDAANSDARVQQGNISAMCRGRQHLKSHPRGMFTWRKAVAGEYQQWIALHPDHAT